MLVGKLIGREGGIVGERKIGRKKTNGKESEDKKRRTEERQQEIVGVTEVYIYQKRF